MTAKKRASPPTFKSDLAKVDQHRVQPAEYDELPELDDDTLARAVVNKGAGRGPTTPAS